MNTPTTETPGAQPAETVATTTPQPGAEPTGATTTLDLRSRPTDELASIIAAADSGTPIVPATQPAATPTAEGTAATETTTPGAEPAPTETTPATPPAEPTPPATPPTGETAPARVSTRALEPSEATEVAQAMSMVRNGQAPNFDAAWKALHPQSAETTAPATPPAAENGAAPTAPTAPPATTPDVASIEATLATLREQRKAAREDFDNDAVEALTIQIEDLVPRLTEARLRAESRQQQEAAYKIGWNQAVQVVETKYPELQDPESPMSEIFDGLILKAQAANDPQLADPNHLVVLADKVAAFMRQGTQQQSSPASARTAPPKPQQAPVGAAVAPAHTPPGKATPDLVRGALKSAPLDDLRSWITD